MPTTRPDQPTRPYGLILLAEIPLVLLSACVFFGARLSQAFASYACSRTQDGAAEIDRCVTSVTVGTVISYAVAVLIPIVFWIGASRVKNGGAAAGWLFGAFAAYLVPFALLMSGPSS